MVDKGMVHGRFQLLSFKHMEYILAAKMRCRKLYIGIVDSDSLHVEGGMDRSEHPFSFIERFEMIVRSLVEFGIRREDFEIIPFPIGKPEYLLQYTPDDVVHYMDLSLADGRARYELLKLKGMETVVLWGEDEKEPGITSAEIRMLIREKQEWAGYVPKAVYRYIMEECNNKDVKRYVC